MVDSEKTQNSNQKMVQGCIVEQKSPLEGEFVDGESETRPKNSIRDGHQEVLQKSLGDRIPLLFIDVNISPSETERISIFENDTPQTLAHQFCQQHNLSAKM